MAQTLAEKILSRESRHPLPCRGYSHRPGGPGLCPGYHRLIQLYTFKDEVVLDPFIGSGTTALAAIKVGRHYMGYDIKEEYVALAERRIREYNEQQLALPVISS